MTKYVLNSGNVRADLTKAKKYFAEVLEGLGTNPKILFCFFGEKREDWEVKFQSYIGDRLPDYMPSGITPKYDMALPNKFIEQCKWADAIYIHGGDDHLIQYWLRKFEVPKIWKDKVVAVSSASMDALATSFWTIDWRELMDGLGVLPIKTIVHYKSNFGADDPRGPIDWEKAKSELEEYGDKSLPVYALEEGDFVVFEV